MHATKDNRFALLAFCCKALRITPLSYDQACLYQALFRHPTADDFHRFSHRLHWVLFFKLLCSLINDFGLRAVMIDYPSQMSNVEFQIS